MFAAKMAHKKIDLLSNPLHFFTPTSFLSPLSIDLLASTQNLFAQIHCRPFATNARILAGF